MYLNLSYIKILTLEEIHKNGIRKNAEFITFNLEILIDLKVFKGEGIPSMPQ